LNQAHGKVSGLTGPEEPAVGGKNWTIVLQRKSEVNAIPQGELVLQRQIERSGQPRSHVEQPGRTFHHQPEGRPSLFG
jgi:hypothetical protein